MGAMLVVAGCSSSVEETTPPGRVLQDVSYVHYGGVAPLDLVVLLDTRGRDVDGALRSSIVAAVRAYARDRTTYGGIPWLASPVDIRFFAIDAANARTLRPAAPIAEWREEDATSAAAEAFATQVEEAIARASDVAGSAGVVAALHDASGAIMHRDDRERVFVIATTADDPGAPDGFDPILRANGSASAVVVVPGRDSATCDSIATPRLAAWASKNLVEISPACRAVLLPLPSSEIMLPCYVRRPIRCRVRALVPVGTPCEQTRGWRTPQRSTPVLDPDYAGLTACEVARLEGQAAAACSNGTMQSNSSESGWCMPNAIKWCSNMVPRVVGRAAPPWATIETACELE